MEVDQQLRILRQAAAGSLPASIDSDSSVPAMVVKELVESGHLEAIDTTTFDGPGFLDARITTSGREHLRILDERARSGSIPGKVRKHSLSAFKWIFAIVAGVVIAYVTRILVG